MKKLVSLLYPVPQEKTMGSLPAYEKSKPPDTERNILWSLRKESLWEQRILQDRDLLNFWMAKVREGEGLREAPKDAEEFERLPVESEEARFELEKQRERHLTSEALGPPETEGGESKALPVGQPKSFLQEAIEGEQMANVVASKVDETLENIRTEPDEVTETQEREGDRHKGEQIKELRDREVESKPMDREELQTQMQLLRSIEQKGQFLRSLLCRLVDSAEYDYQVYALINNLNDRINQETSPMKKAAKRKILTERELELKKMLGHWDNARYAIEWLQRDYSLNFEICEIRGEAESIQARIAQLKADLSHVGDDRILQQRTSDKKKELNQLTGRLNAIKRRNSEILDELKKLELQALVVGFRYKDRNFSGMIEPDDMPELSADLFNKLDVNKSHNVTVTEFERALENMKSRVIRLDNKIKECDEQRIQIQNEREKLKSNLPPYVTQEQQAKIEELDVKLVDQMERKKSLMENKKIDEAAFSKIRQLFQNGFVKDVNILLPVKVRIHSHETPVLTEREKAAFSPERVEREGSGFGLPHPQRSLTGSPKPEPRSSSPKRAVTAPAQLEEIELPERTRRLSVREPEQPSEEVAVPKDEEINVGKQDTSDRGLSEEEKPERLTGDKDKITGEKERDKADKDKITGEKERDKADKDKVTGEKERDIDSTRESTEAVELTGPKSEPENLPVSPKHETGLRDED